MDRVSPEESLRKLVKKIDFVCTSCYNVIKKGRCTMSLNVSGTKYVRVYDTEIKLQVSDRIVFEVCDVVEGVDGEADEESGN